MSELAYIPHKVKCQDGKTRTARVRCYWDGVSWCMHGDTYFSVPARVKVNGKTVAGYVTGTDDGLEFRAYLYRKNHALLTSGK